MSIVAAHLNYLADMISVSNQIQEFPKLSQFLLVFFFYYYYFYFFLFGFYGPFKNISLISSQLFIKGGQNQENRGKDT